MSRTLVTARLQTAFSRAGITKTEWARRCGVSAAAVGQWLSGATMPRADMLEVAVAALGSTMVEFYGGTEAA
jgi:transcriptional regulator with XRE-family HTH domain